MEEPRAILPSRARVRVHVRETQGIPATATSRNECRLAQRNASKHSLADGNVRGHKPPFMQAACLSAAITH